VKTATTEREREREKERERERERERRSFDEKGYQILISEKVCLPSLGLFCSSSRKTSSLACPTASSCETKERGRKREKD